MNTLLYRYPGIKPFEKEESGIFFGRGEEIRTILRKIESNKIITVHGKSGTGKSSLVKAGVLPKLESAHFQDKKKLHPIGIEFGYFHKEDTKTTTSPIDKFITLLKSTDRDDESALLNRIVSIKKSIWLEIKKLLYSQRDQSFIPLIFLDQFEELFSYPEKWIVDFIIQLAEVYYGAPPQDMLNSIERTLILHPELKADFEKAEIQDFLLQPIDIRIIITIRSDRFDQLDRIKKFFPDLMRNTYLLDALQWEGAEEAIRKPALQEGPFLTPTFTYEDKAVEEILTFLMNHDTNNKMEAFQLQLFCHYIEQKVLARKDTDHPLSHITRADLDEDLGMVIQDFYQKIINSFEKEEGEKVRVFVEEKLILDTSVEKRRISLDQAIALQELENQQHLLNKLADARLIREVHTGTGANIYEISHDTLIEPILKAKHERLENDEKNKRRQMIAQADAFTDEGYNKLKAEDYEAAESDFYQTYLLLESIPNTENEQVEALLNLGILFLTQWYNNISANWKDWSVLNKSEKYLLGALEKAEACANDQLQGMAHEKLGILYQLQTGINPSETKPRAVAHYTKAHAAYEKRNNYYLSGKVFEQLANLVDEPDLKQFHLQGAKASYQLSGDFIAILRVEKTMELINSAEPWGYLLDLRNNETLPLTNTVIEIGRTTGGLQNNISFPNQFVSRRHIVIKNDFTIEDLRSRNGTALNSQFISWGRTFNLNNGDTITLADCIPLMFFTHYPNHLAGTFIPEGAWGIFIHGQKYDYLVENSYGIEVISKDNHHTYYELQLYTGQEEKGQVFIRREEPTNRLELMIVDGPWTTLLYTIKFEDYNYQDYILKEKNNWVAVSKRPLTFVNANEKDEVTMFGPSFQIILLNEEEHYE